MKYRNSADSTFTCVNGREELFFAFNEFNVQAFDDIIPERISCTAFTFKRNIHTTR